MFDKIIEEQAQKIKKELDKRLSEHEKTLKEQLDRIEKKMDDLAAGVK